MREQRCACENSKEHRLCEKDYIWNPATCSCENGKYLASIIDDLVIMCDEIIRQKRFQQKALQQLLYLAHIFINYHSIIDSCYYLLLLHKIATKTKAFIVLS